MVFADKYISKQVLFDSFIDKPVSNELKIVITIPVYNEPDIIPSLESINACDCIDGEVEVIIVVNSSEEDSSSIIAFNRETVKSISEWIDLRETSFVTFYVFNVEYLPKKHAGVGLARKIAMDEAVRRFNAINKDDGIICGYDADTLCESNYFQSINNYFKNKKNRGASIYFEHIMNGEFDEMVYSASAFYELYLRYYVSSLKFIGHPHAFHCIGSAYAVRVKDYCLQGGMNRKKAGEDFYFLQKIIALGGYGEINDTVLYPSSRVSDRTPFGTGQSIAEMCKCDKLDYITYNFQAFLDIKKLFAVVDCFFKCDNKMMDEVFDNLSNVLVDFLCSIDFVGGIDEINANCGSLLVFRDKFFKFFNVFRVLKFLNFSHDRCFEKESVIVGTKKFFDVLGEGDRCCNDVFCLLREFRNIERCR